MYSVTYDKYLVDPEEVISVTVSTPGNATSEIDGHYDMHTYTKDVLQAIQDNDNAQTRFAELHSDLLKLDDLTDILVRGTPVCPTSFLSFCKGSVCSDINLMYFHVSGSSPNTTLDGSEMLC
jgi:hypothetical protein